MQSLEGTRFIGVIATSDNITYSLYEDIIMMSAKKQHIFVVHPVDYRISNYYVNVEAVRKDCEDNKVSWSDYKVPKEKR